MISEGETKAVDGKAGSKPKTKKGDGKQKSDEKLADSLNLQQRASLANFDVLPVLYVKNFQGNEPLLRWAVRLSQPVATKYLIVKTLSEMK